MELGFCYKFMIIQELIMDLDSLSHELLGEVYIIDFHQPSWLGFLHKTRSLGILIMD